MSLSRLNTRTRAMMRYFINNHQVYHNKLYLRMIQINFFFTPVKYMQRSLSIDGYVINTHLP
jgi:hypothetical protein